MTTTIGGTRPRQVLREKELVVLLLLVGACYFTRLGALGIRGEESRRGSVTREMVLEGEFAVPRMQGDAYFTSSRPPLQMWAIAAAGRIRGTIDEFAVRFPSVLSVLLLSVVIYGYSRTFLSRMGAFSAAVGWISMLQVLELGRSGETDALFTLFVGCSLLIWHTGYSLNWNPALVWSLGYGFAALATLTKGPQGPVYFGGPVAVYLVGSGNWRYLFRPAHLAGLLTFLLVWGPWQLSFFLAEGVDGVRHIYFGDVAKYGTPGSLLTHLIKYPLETLVCLLPWSLFLAVLFKRGFRQAVGDAGHHLLFLSCCVVVTYPTVWWMAEARTRFFMPLYPCLAVMIGMAIERCVQAADGSLLRRDWNRFLLTFAWVMPVVGLFFLAVTLAGIDWKYARQPTWFAALFMAMSIAGSVVVWKSGRDERLVLQKAAVVAVALFFGLIVNGLRLNAMLSADSHRQQYVADVARRLPPGETLFSLGPADHTLLFYYDEPIERVDYERLSPLPAEVSYFCFQSNDPELPDHLPFCWKPVGVIPGDRDLKKAWRKFVIVGKVMPGRFQPLTTLETVKPLLPAGEFERHFKSNPLRVSAGYRDESRE